MNPSTALATVVVDELVRSGVQHAVLCPGSRSAPLAYALQAADRAGRLTLHVRVDERSAGFLALGLAKLTRVPAVVVTTSGTAVANLHPAVLEAHHGVVPLIALTADRPAELRRTGANQTTVQPGMFADAVRWSLDLEPRPAGDPHEATVEEGRWRTAVRSAVTAATGEVDTPSEPGPAHLNVQLREPLVPTDEPSWPGRSGPGTPGQPAPTGGPGTADVPVAPGGGDAGPLVGLAPTGRDEPVPALSAAPAGIDPGPRTLVVVGDLPDPGRFAAVVEWATHHGWPVVAEPFGGHPREGVVPHGPLLLGAAGWLDDHGPERVVTVGRVTLSRPVTALLRRPGTRVEAVRMHRWIEATPSVAAVHEPHVLELRGEPAGDREWSDAWTRAGQAVARALADSPAQWPSSLAVTATVVSGLPSGATLFVGSSNPVRDLDLTATQGKDSFTVVASRGLAGIDGCVSTAAGIALAGAQPAYALMGDLTFLHDANGLLIGPDEPRPDLTVVVTNDDGGGIFSLLEPGEPERAADFERIFGTPTGTDLHTLCAAHSVAHQRISTPEALREAVARAPIGLRVLEVPVDRSTHRDTHARWRARADAALA